METDLIPYQAITRLPARHVLVIAPHADDEVFGCGGAIASHAGQGVPVSVVVLTDGARHGEPSLRMAESRAAAAVLGYGEPEFWGFADRALRHDQDLVERLVRKIAASGADLIYAPSPWEIHPDHRQTASAAAQAAHQTGVRIAFYEVGSPLRPNLLLDITAYADTKKKAMQCFASQLQQQDYDRHISALNLYRTYTLPREVAAAEAFLLLSAAELATALPDMLVAQPVSLGSSPSASAVGESLPLVSVLICSSDRETLQEALDSVALQTYPGIEVVVMASQTEHPPLSQRCGPFALRLVSTDRPLRRSQAANQTLAQARGEFLMFLGEGDWLLPGHIARLAHVLRHQPGSLAAHADVALTNANGVPLGQVLDQPFDGVRHLAGKRTPIQAALFSRKLLALGCRFDETQDDNADRDFWLQVARHTLISHLPGVSAAHRIHEPGQWQVPEDPDQLRQTVQRQASTIAHQAQELADLRQSSSWKVTAPLRWLSARMKARGQV